MRIWILKCQLGWSEEKRILWILRREGSFILRELESLRVNSWGRG